ncbi:MAG: ATP-binding protein [Lachnospiraceae bacterium]|nr:ATP-binding protein [Lachnospiraceae bacterium]
MKAQHAQRLKDSGGMAERVPSYKCQKCRDTGYYEIEKDGYTYMHECECGKIQRERIESKLAFASIPKEFEGQTVDNFRTDCYSTGTGRELAEMAKTIAKRYVELFDEIQETNAKGLYFHSGVKGSGKTRLAVSIANDLISLKGIPAKFSTTIQILDQIKNTWGERARGCDEINQARTEESLIRDIVSVPVLIVDDIGVEQPKDWINERFYNILNGRMIEKRITIFTSNYRIEELQLDDRIVSRIDKMALPIEFPAESVRAALSRKENNDLMDRLLGI